MSAGELFALIGDPVASSPSPAMHRAAFRALDLPHDYVAVRVTRNGLREGSPRLLQRYAGLNVTTPLKEAVLPLLDRIDSIAAAAGSVNTVVREAGRTLGHSTDGAGFLAALRAAGGNPPARTVVLGAGGAARAVALALRGAGSTVLLAGRDEEKVERVAAELGVAAVRAGALPRTVTEAGLLVNATPLGSAAHAHSSPLAHTVPLHPGLIVFDLVIRPRRTALLIRAEAAGCRTVEGVDMLVEQGARSFELWTGRDAPVEVMRRAARKALEPAEVPA
jgi:shikimate dehydrogenase